MGRPRKPTAVLEASGARAKNPQRYRDRDDEPHIKEPMGPPPPSFLNEHSPTSVALLAIWRELEQQAIPGTLTLADRMHFEMTCRLVYKCRHGSPKSSDFTALNKHLAQMGKNPADRTKIAVKRQKAADQANRFGEFAEGALPPRVQ